MREFLAIQERIQNYLLDEGAHRFLGAGPSKERENAHVMNPNVPGQRPPEARSAGGGPTAPGGYASLSTLLSEKWLKRIP